MRSSTSFSDEILRVERKAGKNGDHKLSFTGFTVSVKDAAKLDPPSGEELAKILPKKNIDSWRVHPGCIVYIQYPNKEGDIYYITMVCGSKPVLVEGIKLSGIESQYSYDREEKIRIDYMDNSENPACELPSGKTFKNVPAMFPLADEWIGYNIDKTKELSIERL